MLYLVLRKEYKIEVPENRAVKIFGPKVRKWKANEKVA
jgi:hypothetical protein